MPIIFKANVTDNRKNSRDEHCPYIKTCKHRIPRNYFIRICNTAAYRKCRFYAKRANKLRTPVNWLQKMAINKEKVKKDSKE